MEIEIYMCKVEFIRKSKCKYVVEKVDNLGFFTVNRLSS